MGVGASGDGIYEVQKVTARNLLSFGERFRGGWRGRDGVMTLVVQLICRYCWKFFVGLSLPSFFDGLQRSVWKDLGEILVWGADS